MNVLDLFSGIGGFSLGLERAGMHTVAFCERDEFCRAVLRKHWPAVPCFEDIHSLDASGLDRLGPIDLVCGGFPCQPFSVAGEQKGKADDRHLWPEMCRVIALARPAWVVGENVAGIITLALDDVLFDLESLGYAARTFVIPACAVDAPHRRDRVWIVARNTNKHSQSTGAIHAEMAELCSPIANAKRDQLRDESGRRRGASGTCEAEPGDDGSSGIVANPHSDERHGRSGALQMGRSSITGEDSGDGRGQGTQWSPEPNVGRTIDGISAALDGNRGFEDADAEETGANEVMRYLRETSGAEAIQRATRGLDGVQAEKVLLDFLREYEAGGRLPREFMASTATPEGMLRAMRRNRESPRPSLRRGSLKQYFGEYPDAMRELSRLVASRGETPWSSAFWESAVPRVAANVPRRVDRLRSLGNAVVPQIVEVIGEAILRAEGQ